MPTTLGIEHAKDAVAAPIAVTGESALAGIYYSLEQNGNKVSDESTESLHQRGTQKPFLQINEEIQARVTMMWDKLNVAYD